MTGGRFGGSSKRLLVGGAALAALAFSGMWGGPALAAGPAATALPTGAQVAAGQVAITTTSSTMNVVQSSSKAIVNWQSFDIGANAAVNFSQPGSNAVALNRIVGQDPSAIYGKLTSNGQVFLINPNGVLFAPGAQVNVGGLVASTLDIGDQSFLTGTYRFNRNGSRGAVVNQGALSAGYVALLGSQVSNGGVISAPMGTVALASGEAVTLGITGQDLVSVQVDKASIDTLVQNNGLIQVDGGVALLTAQSATNLLGQVVNTGEVAANGIESDGGVIRLTASSNIDHSGVLSADAGRNGKGGSVDVIAALDNPASLTRVSGAISARGGDQWGDGGSVETSASHLKIADTARVDTTASNGATGAWLLDPYDFTIGGANGDITGATLSIALASSDVIIATTDTDVSCTGAACGLGDSTGNGDIHVNDAVSWSSAHTLTLSAWNNVNINAPITVSGSGGLALEFAQSDIADNFPFAVYTVNAPVNLAAGAGFSTKMASDGPTISYTVVTDATTLAALASNLGGAYVLGGDVDVAGIASWTPLGTLATPFAGFFDGLGHKVTGLTHVNGGADTEVGLFGANIGQIQNVGVTGVNVAGSQNVGALVGFNNGFVVNSYATGSVTGSGANAASPVGGIGGLIGYSAGPIFGSYANVTVSATTGDQSSASPLGTFANPRGTGGIGGLTGVATSGVTSSYATGAVTGNHAVGGLVGYSAAGIQSTYSTGLVTGATVNAVAATNVGGLIGAVDNPSSPFPFIFSSFWDVTTSGQSSSAMALGDDGNVVGLTTSQMNTASTFTGDWITSGAWELRDGQNPLLKQMLQPIFVIADNKTTTYNGSAVTGFTSTIAPAGLGSNYTGTVTVTPSTANPTNAGSYTLTASGLSLTSPGDQHGYRLEYVDGALTINPAAIITTITGELTGTFSKTYDGTNAANGLNAANFLLSGWQGDDGATVTETSGLFDNANAGTNKTITVALTASDFTASDGTNLSNYILPTSVEGDIGTITPKALGVTVARTYDGTASFTTGFTFTGLVGDDATPTVTSGSATVSSANAATYASFATNGLTLSNSNYTLAGGTVSATITPKALGVTAAKTYDGTNSFTTGFTFTGMVGNDAAPTATGSATVSSANAATYASFATNGLTLSNANYTLAGGTVSATINPAALIASLTGAFSKTYDATTAVNGLSDDHFLLTGWQGEDSATVTETSGLFDDANVGTNKTITVTLTAGDFTASGATNLANYILPASVQGSIGAITPATLGVTVAKTYNGTNSFTTGFTFTGMVGNDAAPTATGSATVSSANAATYASFATNGLTLSNANYTLAGGAVSATINPAALTGVLQGTFSKTYDATTAASGLNATNFLLSGWQGEDGATVTETSGLFDNANAGAGKTITVALTAGDFTASGATNLSNYVLPTSVQGAMGTITPKALGVTAAKTYDGTTSFTTGFTFTGLVGNDAAPTVTSGSATVSSANAATYASFATNGLTLSNANYTLAGGTVSATISPAILGVTVAKTYDGTDSFTTGFTFTGLVADDAPTVTGSATVSSRNAATYASFATHSLALSDSNYTLDGGTVSATITPKALDVLTLSQPIHSSLTPAVGALVTLSVNTSVASGTAGILPIDGPLTLTGSAKWDVTEKTSGGEPIKYQFYMINLHSGEQEKLQLSGQGAGNYTLTGTSVSAKIQGSSIPLSPIQNIRNANSQAFNSYNSSPTGVDILDFSTISALLEDFENSDSDNFESWLASIFSSSLTVSDSYTLPDQNEAS